MAPLNIAEKRNDQRVKIITGKSIVISPLGIGRILDASDGGFSAEYFGTEFTPGKTLSTNILSNNGSCLNNIPIMIKHISKPAFAPKPGKIIGCQFRVQDCSTLQKFQIKEFVSYNNPV